mmetsp:Transcript_28473/g.64497  ORF Transcript_28473/g.64497 Transcript_28473/m.64497 type:complete len:218 (+) Transcript_28473:149-802(+)
MSALLSTVSHRKTSNVRSESGLLCSEACGERTSRQSSMCSSEPGVHIPSTSYSCASASNSAEQCWLYRRCTPSSSLCAPVSESSAAKAPSALTALTLRAGIESATSRCRKARRTVLCRLERRPVATKWLATTAFPRPLIASNTDSSNSSEAACTSGESWGTTKGSVSTVTSSSRCGTTQEGLEPDRSACRNSIATALVVASTPNCTTSASPRSLGKT